MKVHVRKCQVHTNKIVTWVENVIVSKEGGEVKVCLQHKRYNTGQKEPWSECQSNFDSLTQAKKCELLYIIEEDKTDIIALTEINPKHATFETSAAFFILKTIYDLFLTPESEGKGFVIYNKCA